MAVVPATACAGPASYAHQLNSPNLRLKESKGILNYRCLCFRGRLEMTRGPDTDRFPTASRSLSRRSFTLLATTAFAARQGSAHRTLKVLAVVAHPDDEYAFAV